MDLKEARKIKYKMLIEAGFKYDEATHLKDRSFNNVEQLCEVKRNADEQVQTVIKRQTNRDKA
jgi:hypothetical protein